MDNNENSLREITVSTYKKDGSYCVKEGSVDLYISRRAVNIGSIIEESPIFFRSFEKGCVIPSLNYKDKGYVFWYFIMKYNSDEAELAESESVLTEEQKRAFIEMTPAAPFYFTPGTDENNRFNDSLVSWYQVEEIRSLAMGGDDAQSETVFDVQQAGETLTVDCINEIYTYSTGDMYRVQSGSVNVFVGCSYSLEKKKMFCLTTVEQGGVIPSFGYRDAGGTKWYFKIAAAKNQAELIKLPTRASEANEKALLEQVGVLLGTGGYNDSITEWYNTKAIKPIIAPQEGEDFDIENVSLKPHYIEGSIPVFKAVSYACFKANIAHYSEEELLLCCGDGQLSVEKIAEFSHFICRKIVLEDGWWKNDCGPIIGEIDGVPVACAPKGGGKYTIYYGNNDGDAADDELLTPEIARKIHPAAYSIGRTVPPNSLSKKELFAFCKKSVNKGDLTAVIILGLVGALIGILLPTLNQKIYDDYIPLGNYSQLIQICVVIGSFMIGNFFFGVVKNISEYRISSRIAYDLQNAAIYRSFYLPEKFFRQHDSADLAQRILQIDEAVSAYTNLIIVSGMAFIFNFLYLFRMFKYSKKLTWAAIAMMLVYAALLFFMNISASKKEKKIVSANGEANGKLYQFLCAIDKIRMAGAEERAVQRYSKPLREREVEKIKKGRIMSLSEALRAVATTLFSMVLYYIMIKKKVDLSIGNFTAFNTAFGAFSAALMTMMERIAEVYASGANVERIMPVFQCEPEYATDKGKNKQTIQTLTGRIKVSDVSFAYSEGGPMVLKGLSMDIEPGDYVGIVGRSGCGKSTLFKLLLGFENPTGGKILIDGKNLTEIDKKSYRRNLGVVLQNGKLINGSIQENITITAPNAKYADVKKVIEAVGLADDIAQMPMGVNTMLNENSNTISGGQQQRILIARAIIGNPKLILLDEATSALDNITQKAVCDTLDRIDATKIVIAHRLSTVQKCNKIFVLDGGRIVESGSYEELMHRKGLFAEMAARQLVNGETDDD